MEGVTYTPEGLEAIIFTADGDMRNALNTLQATSAGFGLVDGDNVFKVRWIPCHVLLNLMDDDDRFQINPILSSFGKS